MNPLQVNIIGKSNGVGLARDIEMLGAALRERGHSVVVTTIDAVQARRRRSILLQLRVRAGAGRRRPHRTSPAPNADLNIMLEHVWAQYLETAKLNIAVPNPEWFDHHDRRVLQLVDQVWAKTDYTLQVFGGLGCSTTYIGFDSADRYEGDVRKERTYFHLAGKSDMKGTDRLLRVWGRHPDWPRLIVVLHRKKQPKLPALPNVELHVGYLSDPVLRAMQNQSTFHVCLSLTEGWGHYIVEALSTAAVTVTVDAAPMNELVRPERGVLVAYGATGTQRLAQTYHFDERQLEDAIERTLSMSDAECLRIGGNARDWFLGNKDSFSQRLETALRALPPASSESICTDALLADGTDQLRR
jgi:hypothetical protein